MNNLITNHYPVVTGDKYLKITDNITDTTRQAFYRWLLVVLVVCALSLCPLHARAALGEGTAPFGTSIDASTQDVILLADGHSQNADDILGNWWRQGKKTAVQVYKENNRYFVRILWDEVPRFDTKNRDESLRGRPLKGVTYVEDMIFNAEEGRWDGGTIYSPDRGRIFPSRAWLSEDDNQLTLRGYLRRTPGIGRNVVYVRFAPGDTVPE